jgi:ABC-type uncharacterized transport system ATPase subunit
MNEQLERIEEQVAAGSVEVTVVEPSEKTEEKIRVEELKISGDALVAKIKELIAQGNIRCIIIKNGSGRTLVEIPLTVGVVSGVVGAIVFPVAAALTAIGVLAAHLTIVIARKEIE